MRIITASERKRREIIKVCMAKAGHLKTEDFAVEAMEEVINKLIERTDIETLVDHIISLGAHNIVFIPLHWCPRLLKSELDKEDI